MSPRNRSSYIAEIESRAETIRARAIWEWRRRHVTADRGALCEDVRSIRLGETAHGSEGRKAR